MKTTCLGGRTSSSEIGAIPSTSILFEGVCLQLGDADGRADRRARRLMGSWTHRCPGTAPTLRRTRVRPQQNRTDGSHWRPSSFDDGRPADLPEEPTTSNSPTWFRHPDFADSVVGHRMTWPIMVTTGYQGGGSFSTSWRVQSRV